MSTLDLIKASLHGACLNQDEYNRVVKWVEDAVKAIEREENENKDCRI